MSFYIGDCSARSCNSRDIRTIPHIRDTKNLRDGDIVNLFGHILKWDWHDCVSEETCHAWRAMGDPACDAALQTIFPSSTSSVGKDLLVALEEYVALNPGPNPASLFLEEVSQTPPGGIQVSEKDVEIAQVFFIDYAMQIMQALLHYSLAAGFASPRIVRTLQAVSYLVPPVRKRGDLSETPVEHTASSASDKRTFSRLLETFQFVLDVTGCTSEPPPSKGGKADYLLPGGEGWKSAIRVRMLHGVARRRAAERRGKYSSQMHEQEVPISQEDMSATLVSFSTVPIFALTRLHLKPSEAQISAYLTLWRHVGFYLGVSPSILTRYLHSPATAEKFLASIVLDLFSDDSPLDLRTLPTIPILRAVSNRPPSHGSLEYHIAVTRYMTGPALADHLGLPPTSPWTRVKLHAALLVQAVPVWFAAWYPRRVWLEKRRAVLREGMARSLRWNLGMRQVTFRPRTDVKPSPAGMEDDVGGELANGVREAENVASNPAAGRRLTRVWREVLAEMIGVLIFLAVLTSVGTWWIVTSIRSYLTI